MQIIEVTESKENFIDILLIGDEDRKMINKYLNQSTLFSLYDDDLKSVCAVVEIDKNTIEIKNIATYPKYQNRGYATMLIDFVCNKYKNNFKTLILGTGENAKTLNFYKKRGFIETHRIKNFFVDNYSRPIIEDEIQLIDMIYLRKNL